MKIVVVGAGNFGTYIAKLLSEEEHDVVLVDKEPHRLQAAAEHLDVSSRVGSGSDWQLLDSLFELSPELIIAATDNDELNLVCCSMAKQLGYPKTMARIRDSRLLNRSRLDFGRIFDVDDFIGPELLVAHDIVKYMLSPSSVFVENFAHGAVQLRTIIVPEKWRRNDKSISELRLPEGIIIGLIQRETDERHAGISLGKKKVIFPHGQDRILPRDEVTCIGELKAIQEIHHFFGIPSKPMKSAFIVGGSLTAFNLAKLLEMQSIDTTIVEKDFDRCAKLSVTLPQSTIINHDGTDIGFLKSEKVASKDLFVAATGIDEVNMMASLMAKELGQERVVSLLSNTGYRPIASQLGIAHTVSPIVSAASQVLSRVFSGTVRSLVSLYDNQAEIMEINVRSDSPVIGVPLSELGPLFPSDFLIAMIQNRGRTMIANGSRIISSGDTVIVITSPKHIPEMQGLF